MPSIKINKENIIQIPDEIILFSNEQCDDFSNSCLAFANLSLTDAQRTKHIRALYPLFCAYHVQPIRDGFYSYDNVLKLWDDFKIAEDLDLINEIGAKFACYAGMYLTKILNEQYLKKALHDINKFQSN